MLNSNNNSTKLIMETWRRFLNENETEVETVNKNVDAGDWIIRAMTDAGEEYVVKQAKFPKLYDEKPVKDGPDGFQVYNVKPDVRTGIVIDSSLEKTLASEFSNKTLSQKEMHEWMQENASPVKVQKHKQAFAKQAEGGETIVTKVAKAGGEIMKFEAPWGGTMPVKSNDVLIINDDEVYRIARAEFDQTYEFV